MASAFWSTITRFDRAQLKPAMALRNALGVAIPLAAGLALGNASGGAMSATGALNVAFSDGADPYFHRGRRMLSAALFVALAVFAGRLCGHNHLLALLLEAACAFAAGLLVAAGPTPGDIGSITLVTLIVFSASPASAGKAFSSGLLAMGGGLLQTIFALALWPVHRHLPESRALALLYEELARSAASSSPATESPAATEPVLAARASLATLDSARSLEAERLLALLSQAERIRLALLALGRLHARIARETGSSADAALLDRSRELIARMLRSVGTALAAGIKGDSHPECLRELRSLAEQLRAEPPASTPVLAATRADARWQLDALTGQLASAVELAARISQSGTREFDRLEQAQPWTLRLAGVLAVLRSNLTLDSAAFRHALRLAACVVMAESLTRGIGMQRAYWAPMTVAIVLKPDFTTTFSRGVLRLAGTFIGLALATALFHALSPGPALQSLFIVVFVFLMRWAGPANYGVLVTALTALIVLLFASTGVAPSELISARALYTVVGGCIALAAYRVWPTWERTQVPEALARLLDAYRSYFQAVRDAYLHPGLERDPQFAHRLEQVRQAGRLARTTLEASMARLRLEPGVAASRMTTLQAVLANSHRFIHAAMALEAGLFRSQPVPARPQFATFANDVDSTLYFLAAYLRGVPATPGDLPDLREDHRALLQSGVSHAERYELVSVEADRLTNSLNTLAVEIIQWVGSSRNV